LSTHLRLGIHITYRLKMFTPVEKPISTTDIIWSWNDNLQGKRRQEKENKSGDLLWKFFLLIFMLYRLGAFIAYSNPLLQSCHNTLSTLCTVLRISSNNRHFEK
jgi:hypothetical protein